MKCLHLNKVNIQYLIKTTLQDSKKTLLGLEKKGGGGGAGVKGVIGRGPRAKIMSLQ